MAAGELAGLDRYDARLKVMKAELKAAVLASGSHLTGIHGIGPAAAARVLADVGDVARFPDRNHFASPAGTAPIDASQRRAHPPPPVPRREPPAEPRAVHGRHRRLRNDTPGRACYRRKLAGGKTPMEAMRCLRRRLSDVACRQLVADAATRAPVTEKAGPGGHSGTILKSSAADLTPDVGSSDQPLPGPAPLTLPPARARQEPPGPGQLAHRDDAPEASMRSAPPDERH
jgi:hypothetical protein